jgi:hypothetical protein
MPTQFSICYLSTNRLQLQVCEYGTVHAHQLASHGSVLLRPARRHHRRRRHYLGAVILPATQGSAFVAYQQSAKRSMELEPVRRGWTGRRADGPDRNFRRQESPSDGGIATGLRPEELPGLAVARARGP